MTLEPNLLNQGITTVVPNRCVGEQLLTEAGMALERTAVSLKSSPNNSDTGELPPWSPLHYLLLIH